jgi:putative transposase
VVASFAGTGLAEHVARQLRIQYPRELYHVINRGNFRSDVFEMVEARTAVVRIFAQACGRHGCAYVLMRDHYHLALETSEPNLAVGLQWLQATFAARVNRHRSLY